MSSRSSIRRQPARILSKRRRELPASAGTKVRDALARRTRFVIEIVNQQRVLPVATARIRRIARRTLEAEMVASATISIALVDNRMIHDLNRRHLNHDYETDVLSFLFESETGVPVPIRLHSKQCESARYIDGEIVISAEMAVQSALRYGWSASKEMELYLVHGLLHLCGYDDGTDSERRLMRRRERSIMKLVGE
jgi:probable rRNA maturation factor